CDADLPLGPTVAPTITKSYAQPTVAQGGSTSVTLVAANGAAAGGPNPTITDTFPAGQAPGNVTGMPNGFTCTTTGQTVSCTRAAALAPNEATAVTIPVSCS